MCNPILAFSVPTYSYPHSLMILILIHMCFNRTNHIPKCGTAVDLYIFYITYPFPDSWMTYMTGNREQTLGGR
jgi:hypothetical protein